MGEAGGRRFGERRARGPSGRLCGVLALATLGLGLLGGAAGSRESSRPPEESTGAGVGQETPEGQVPELAPPDPAIPLDPTHPEGWESLACAECHADVVREWAGSAHAVAWLDRPYREELEGRRRPELCYGCHIPEPLLADGTLVEQATFRTEARDLGVSCESCHLGPEGAMLGPRGTPTDAHPTVVSEAFLGSGSDALCAVCHATNVGPVLGVAQDFELSRQSERGRSCVGCHMAPVQRPFAGAAPAQAEDADRGEAGDGAAGRLSFAGRSHALQTPRDPAFLRRAFAFEVHREDAVRTVRVRNEAGHKVPALIGREIELRAELLGPGGEVSGHAELALDALSRLEVDQTLGLEIDPVEEVEGGSIRIVGDHLDPRSDELVRFLDLVLPDPPVAPASGEEAESEEAGRGG